MRRIPLTIGFDKTRVIGYVDITEDMEIPFDCCFALAYRILESDAERKPIKWEVVEASLMTNYFPHPLPDLTDLARLYIKEEKRDDTV